LGKDCLAIEEWKPAQIVAVEMEQIEGEIGERFPGVFLKGGLQVGKAGGTVFGEDNDFAIKNRVIDGNVFYLLRDGAHTVGPVKTGAGEELDPRSVFASLNAIAVELQLMKPPRSFGRIAGRQREFGCNETGKLFRWSLAQGSGQS
jgi:hypothetical protein